ncbi:MAG TPA: VOC family protein [bacterium]|nr:VOC family protein [bacterium]
MQVQPYVCYDGRCEEALEFNRRALGAEVTALIRFKDAPEPRERDRVAAEGGDKVLHAAFRVGETQILASDGQCLGHPTFQGFGLSLTVPKDAETDRVFAALGDGGRVQAPLTKTFFSSRFGMVADRFGVLWMVYVA